jgi:hypothetical protein
MNVMGKLEDIIPSVPKTIEVGGKIIRTNIPVMGRCKNLPPPVRDMEKTKSTILKEKLKSEFSKDIDINSKVSSYGFVKMIDELIKIIYTDESRGNIQTLVGDLPKLLIERLTSIDKGKKYYDITKSNENFYKKLYKAMLVIGKLYGDFCNPSKSRIAEVRPECKEIHDKFKEINGKLLLSIGDYIKKGKFNYRMSKEEQDKLISASNMLPLCEK